jgi:hypothetical protein
MTSVQLLLLLLATVLTIQAYFQYYARLAALKIVPNRWSWLIWTGATGVEVVTFQGVSADMLTTAVFAASFAACAIITVMAWTRGAWLRPNRTELVCVAASFSALVIAFGLREVWWAHLVALCALPVSLETFSR